MGVKHDYKFAVPCGVCGTDMEFYEGYPNKTSSDKVKKLIPRKLWKTVCSGCWMPLSRALGQAQSPKKFYKLTGYTPTSSRRDRLKKVKLVSMAL